MCVIGTCCDQVWQDHKHLVSSEDVAQCGPLGHISQAQGSKGLRLPLTFAQCVRFRSGVSQNWKGRHGPSCEASEPTSAARHLCAVGGHSQDVDLGGPLCRGGDPSLRTGQRKPMGGDSLYSCARAIVSLEGQEAASQSTPVSLAHLSPGSVTQECTKGRINCSCETA